MSNIEEKLNEIINSIGNELNQGKTWSQSRDFLNSKIDSLKGVKDEYKDEVNNFNNDIDKLNTDLTSKNTSLNNALDKLGNYEDADGNPKKSKWETVATSLQTDLDKWTGINGVFPDNQFKIKGLTPEKIKEEYSKEKITDEQKQKIVQADKWEVVFPSTNYEAKGITADKIKAEYDKEKITDDQKAKLNDLETNFPDSEFKDKGITIEQIKAGYAQEKLTDEQKQELVKLTTWTIAFPKAEYEDKGLTPDKIKTELATLRLKAGDTAELDKVKADLAKKIADEQDLLNQINALKTTLATDKSKSAFEKQVLQNQIDQKETDLAQLRADIKLLNTRKTKLETDIKKIKATENAKITALTNDNALLEAEKAELLRQQGLLWDMDKVNKRKVAKFRSKVSREKYGERDADGYLIEERESSGSEVEGEKELKAKLIAQQEQPTK